MLNFDHSAHGMEGLRKGVKAPSPSLREGRELLDLRFDVLDNCSLRVNDFVELLVSLRSRLIGFEGRDDLTLLAEVAFVANNGFFGFQLAQESITKDSDIACTVPPSRDDLGP